MHWDPQTYLQFADERTRPWFELLSRIRTDDSQVRRVTDLGCGPGTLTRTLLERWPDSIVEGVDSSAEMVAEATAQAVPGRLRFTVQDLREWVPQDPVDVLVSNATLQWVPGHLELLPRLLSAVRPGGWFAFQVPGNFTSRPHTAIAELLAQPRWAHRFAGVDLARPASEDPWTYLEALVGAASSVDVWETTYQQVLQGPDAIVRWISGTGLRPVLTELDEAEREEFLAAYRPLVAQAHPERPWGTVLPFRRIFVVTQR